MPGALWLLRCRRAGCGHEELLPHGEIAPGRRCAGCLRRELVAFAPAAAARELAKRPLHDVRALAAAPPAILPARSRTPSEEEI